MSEAIRITLIDDDEAIRESIADILLNEGYEVSVYANGKEALEGLSKAEGAPRIILCDLMMPVMNGWQFLEAQESQKEFGDVPVLVISATPDVDTLEHKTVREVVSKPFDVEVLLSLVGKYCGRPEAS